MSVAAEMIDTDFTVIEGSGPKAPEITTIPEDHRFDECGAFMISDAIGALGEWLVGHKDALKLAREKNISYLWKRKGGTINGKQVLGKCGKTPPLAKTYDGSTDFTIWLAADHCREFGMTPLQLEALLFHQILHVGEKVNDQTDEVKPIVNAHETEFFWAEIDEYGLWTSELKRSADVFKQIGIPELGSIVPFGGRF